MKNNDIIGDVLNDLNFNDSEKQLFRDVILKIKTSKSLGEVDNLTSNIKTIIDEVYKSDL